MSRSAVVIATLVISNILLGVALFISRSGAEPVLKKLDTLHINTHDGLMRATFQSDSGQNVIVLTPRAAVGLHHELGQMLLAVDQMAREANRGGVSKSQIQ
jgi:hypothetical protein